MTNKVNTSESTITSATTITSAVATSTALVVASAAKAELGAAQVDAAELSKALKAVTPFAQKTNNPITLCVKITAAKNELTLTAGLGIPFSASYKISAEVEGKIEVCIPAKRFSEFVNALSKSSKRITLKVNKEGNDTLLKLNNTYSMYAVADTAKAYGEDAGAMTSLEVELKKFNSAIQKVIPAVSTDKTARPINRAISFGVEGTTLKTLALSGNQAAENIVELLAESAKVNFAIRADVLKVFIANAKAQILIISYDAKKFSLQAGDYEVKGYLTGALNKALTLTKKPNEDWVAYAVLSRKEVLNFLAASQIITDNAEMDGYKVKLSFSRGRGVYLSAKSGDVGGAEWFIATDTCSDGGNLNGKYRIKSINANYLKNAVSVVQGDSVEIRVVPFNGAEFFIIKEVSNKTFNYWVKALPSAAEQIVLLKENQAKLKTEFEEKTAKLETLKEETAKAKELVAKFEGVEVGGKTDYELKARLKETKKDLSEQERMIRESEKLNLPKSSEEVKKISECLKLKTKELKKAKVTVIACSKDKKADAQAVVDKLVREVNKLKDDKEDAKRRFKENNKAILEKAVKTECATDNRYLEMKAEFEELQARQEKIDAAIAQKQEIENAKAVLDKNEVEYVKKRIETIKKAYEKMTNKIGELEEEASYAA